MAEVIFELKPGLELEFPEGTSQEEILTYIQRDDIRKSLAENYGYQFTTPEEREIAAMSEFGRAWTGFVTKTAPGLGMDALATFADAVGADDLMNSAANIAKRYHQEASKYSDYNDTVSALLSDDEEAASFSDWLASAYGNVAGSLTLTGVAAGLGAVAGLPFGGPAGAAAGATAGAGLMGFLLGTGEASREQRDAAGTNDIDAGIAIGAGAASGALDAAPVGLLLLRGVRSVGPLAGAAIGLATEGVTEGTQSLVTQSAGAAEVNRPVLDFFSDPNVWQQAGEEAVVGALGGGTIGAIGGTVNRLAGRTGNETPLDVSGAGGSTVAPITVPQGQQAQYNGAAFTPIGLVTTPDGATLVQGADASGNIITIPQTDLTFAPIPAPPAPPSVPPAATPATTAKPDQTPPTQQSGDTETEVNRLLSEASTRRLTDDEYNFLETNLGTKLPGQPTSTAPADMASNAGATLVTPGTDIVGNVDGYRDLVDRLRAIAQGSPASLTNSQLDLLTMTGALRNRSLSAISDPEFLNRVAAELDSRLASITPAQIEEFEANRLRQEEESVAAETEQLAAKDATTAEKRLAAKTNQETLLTLGYTPEVQAQMDPEELLNVLSTNKVYVSPEDYAMLEQLKISDEAIFNLRGKTGLNRLQYFRDNFDTIKETVDAVDPARVAERLEAQAALAARKEALGGIVEDDINLLKQIEKSASVLNTPKRQQMARELEAIERDLSPMGSLNNDIYEESKILATAKDPEVSEPAKRRVQTIEAQRKRVNEILDQWLFMPPIKNWNSATIGSIGRTVRRVTEARTSKKYSRSDTNSNPTIVVDGVERPTLNSLGQPLAQSQEGIISFWRWFGDSKVVDAQGRPKVVYHGTSQDFESFGRDFLTSNLGEFDDSKIGFMFTDKPNLASLFSTVPVLRASKTSGQTIPVYLKIDNPAIVDFRKSAGMDIAYNPLDLFGALAKKFNKSYFEVQASAKNDLISNGYDGLIVENSTFGILSKSQQNFVNASKKPGWTVFTALEPTQIKSVFNIGTFLPNDSRLQFSRTDQDVANLQKAQAKTEQLAEKLRARLAALGLPDIGLSLQDRLTSYVNDQEISINGTYAAKLIEVSLEYGEKNAFKTLNHEVIHALRDLGLFTSQEWDVLQFEAARSWLNKYNIPAKYPDLSRSEQLEEAIAEAFAARARGTERFMAAIRTILRAIKSVFTEAALTPNAIFDSVTLGNIGRRSVQTQRTPLLNAQIATARSDFGKFFGRSVVVTEGGTPAPVFLNDDGSYSLTPLNPMAPAAFIRIENAVRLPTGVPLNSISVLEALTSNNEPTITRNGLTYPAIFNRAEALDLAANPEKIFPALRAKGYDGFQVGPMSYFPLSESQIAPITNPLFASASLYNQGLADLSNSPDAPTTSQIKQYTNNFKKLSRTTPFQSRNLPPSQSMSILGRWIAPMRHVASQNPVFAPIFRLYEQMMSDRLTIAERAARPIPLPNGEFTIGLNKAAEYMQNPQVRDLINRALEASQLQPVKGRYRKDANGTITIVAPASGGIGTDSTLRPNEVIRLNGTLADIYIAIVESTRFIAQSNTENYLQSPNILNTLIDMQNQGLLNVPPLTEENVAATLDTNPQAYKDAIDAINARIVQTETDITSTKQQIQTLKNTKGVPVQTRKAQNNVLKTKLSNLQDILKKDQALLETNKSIGNVLDAQRRFNRIDYVPFERFGDYYISVRDPQTKRVVWYEQVESSFLNRTKGGTKTLDNRLAQIRAKFPNMDIKSGPNVLDEVLNMANENQLTILSAVESRLTYKGDIDKVKDMRNIIQAKGFARHGLERKNIPGYSTDFLRAISNYVITGSGAAARARYQPSIDSLVADVTTGRTPVDTNTKNFITSANEYMTTPQEEWATTRMFGFLWYLGGNFSSAILQLASAPTIALPVATMFTSAPRAAALMTKHYAVTARTLSPIAAIVKRDLKPYQVREVAMDVGRVPAAYRDQVMRGWEDGTIKQLGAIQEAGLNPATISGSAQAAFQRRFDSIARVLGSMFSTMEATTRLGSFMAAIDIARDPTSRAKILQQMNNDPLLNDVLSPVVNDQKEFEYRFAQWFIDTTMAQFGKIGTAEMNRGFMSVVTQFTKHPHQMLALMWRMAFNHGADGKRAFAYMAAMMFLAGGLLGLPGAEDLRDLIEYLTSLMGGSLDMNKEFRELMDEMDVPNTVTNMVLKGSLTALNIDVGSRITMGQLPVIGDFLRAAGGDGVTLETLGPVPSVIYGAQIAYDQMRQGRNLEALASVSPAFIRNMIQAFDQAENGIRTRAGAQIVTPEEISRYERLLRNFGFNSTETANARELFRTEQRLSQTATDRTSRYNVILGDLQYEIARAMRANNSNKAMELQIEQREIMQQIWENNRKAAALGNYSEIIKIDWTTIRNRAIMRLNPDANITRARQQVRPEIQELRASGRYE